MNGASIPQNASTDQLRKLAVDYNWGDGIDIPKLIASHPNCDLSVALELFWLADADLVVLGNNEVNAYNEDWHAFCVRLAERIREGKYAKGSEVFFPRLTRVQVYNLRKQGLPEVFLGGAS